MNILGLNAYHADASACLLRDGVLIAAAEEERFRRIKHWAGFPSEAIRYCLDEAGVALEDIDHVALNQDSSANLWRKIAYLLTSRPDLSLVLDRLRNKRERTSVPDQLKALFPSQTFRGEVHHVEHHFAHLASAFLVSPFDEAVVVSLDGFGDFASAEWGIGSGSDITVVENEVFRILKPGGLFCARTPHACHYASVCSRLLCHPRRFPFLKRAQPLRDEQDMFETWYRCNMLRKISRTWSNDRWANYSYLYTAEPSYDFGSKAAYRFLRLLHKFLPQPFVCNIFVFKIKRQG